MEDKSEVEVYVPSAKETHIYFDPPQCTFTDLKAKIEALLKKVCTWTLLI